MTPITGRVEWLEFSPGSEQMLVTVSQDDGIHTVQPSQHVYLDFGPGSEVTFDGVPVTFSSFLAIVTRKDECTATLHPRMDRYGACTKAEFCSLPTQ